MAETEVPQEVAADQPEPTGTEAAEMAAEVNDRSASAQADIAATLEALLVVSDKPLTAQKLSQLGELGGVRNVRKAVDVLNGRYERAGCAFRIVEIAGGYQIQTLPEYNDVVSRLVTARREARLSQAAMETLAIAAYRQPVLRADIEAIRGVGCGEVLRGLMEKNLLRIAGRADEIGRPLLYGTTRHFLEVFGLAGLSDLPSVEQLRMPPETPAPAEPAPEADQDQEQGDGPDEEAQDAQADDS